MLKVVNKSITVSANGTTGNKFDFSQEFNGHLPVIREVVCLNDLSALRNKLFISLKKSNLEMSNLEDVDLFGLSSAFEKKVDLEAAGGEYDYTLKSLHDAETVIYLQFSLEY